MALEINNDTLKAFFKFATDQNTAVKLKAVALDPDMKRAPFTLVDDTEDENTSSRIDMEISFDKDGELKFNAKYVKGIHFVHEGADAGPGEEDLRRPTAGRTVTTVVKLSLPQKAFDQYAELGAEVNGQRRITKLDNTEAKKIEKNDDVDGKPEKMVNALGNDFKISELIQCNSDWKAELG